MKTPEDLFSNGQAGIRFNNPFQTFEVPELIYETGMDGLIYRISERHVVKIPKGRLSGSIYEAAIAQKAYEEGISVPRPYGIHKISFPDGYKKRAGFVMDFIRGRVGRSLAGGMWEEIAKDLVEQELDKARSKGFKPNEGNHPGNYFLVSPTQVKLIDFRPWLHPNIPLPDI